MQVHRRRWVCEQCDFVALYRQEMVGHLQSNHSKEFSTKHWNSRLTIYERAMEDSQPTACPFCSRRSTLRSIFKHLAKHMEDLSLFALPNLQDLDVEAKDENSSEFTGTSKSVIAGIEEPLDRDLRKSAVTFSALTSEISSTVQSIHTIMDNSKDLSGLRDHIEKILPGLHDVLNLFPAFQAITTPLKYQQRLDSEKHNLVALLANIKIAIHVLSSETTRRTKPPDPNLRSVLRELAERLQAQTTKFTTLLTSIQT